MNALNLLKSERKFILYIGCGVGVVRKFSVVVKPVIFSTKAKRLMPFQAYLFPFFKPVEFCTGLNKKLHFHLFKFAHSENKLSRNYFVSKRLAYLSNSKRHFH